MTPRRIRIRKRQGTWRVVFAWLTLWSPEFETWAEAMEFVDSKIDCRKCKHPNHNGRRCMFPITEEIRDDVGIFAPPSGERRLILLDTCGCDPVA